MDRPNSARIVRVREQNEGHLMEVTIVLPYYEIPDG